MTHRIKTRQSIISFSNETIQKVFRNTRNNKLSSVEHEIYCIEKFSCGSTNIHSPNIIESDDKSYRMERYDFPLGILTKLDESFVRRMLFTISIDEVMRQLNRIRDILKEKDIRHRDINPGNLLFSEKEKAIKLIDFFWAETDGKKIREPTQLNIRYGTNDEKALETIKQEIKRINRDLQKKVDEDWKPHIRKLGVRYYDGSSSRPGRTFHKLDIPCFSFVPFQRNIEPEYQAIINSMSIVPKTVIDIGCSAGYYLFNMMRRFRLQKVIGYEADPVLFGLLTKIRSTFNLTELNLFTKVNSETEFEPVDIVICMNVHMWLQERIGKEKTNQLLRKLIQGSKELYFQTAGRESFGRVTIKELSNKDIISDFLYNLGASQVSPIHITKLKGRKRYLFKVE